MVGSTATILAGTNSSGSVQTVSMSWRTKAQSDGADISSDIVHLSGMSWNDLGKTSPFVLQMDYDSGYLPGMTALDDTLYLAWLNPNTDQWENAINSNIGTNLGSYHVGAWQDGDMTLGDWGVNTVNHTVWAVLDHNSDFAVTPEPGTLTLLAVGAVGVVGWAWRRRRKGIMASRQDDEPAILSFLSQQGRRPKTKQQAA